MEKYTGIIKKIESALNGGYDISIAVYKDNEIDEIMNFKNDAEFVMHVNEYLINIQHNIMDPVKDSEAQECMDVYHKYEYSDNLNPELRRQWKTAYILDNIAHKIISSNLLDKISI